jgi:hypothetical protein
MAVLGMTAAAVGCGKTGPKCTPAAAVTFASDDPSYLPAAVRACAFGVSCSATNSWVSYDVNIEHQTPRSCLADWNPNGLDDVACAPNARNCDEWMACASHNHCPDWCAAHGYTADKVVQWTCDGDEVVVCDETRGGYGIPFIDCAEEGMHCAVSRYSAACTDGTTCTTPSNPHCDGNRVVACDESTLFGQSQDCSATGATCMTVSFGALGASASCVTPPAGGNQCDPNSFQPHCDGTAEVSCFDGYLIRNDCAAPSIEGTCTTLANGFLDCVPQATECDASTTDTCDGQFFVTCGTNHKLLRVDCVSLGFHSCGDIGGRVGCK